MLRVFAVLLLSLGFALLSGALLMLSLVSLLSFKPLGWVMFGGAWLLVPLLGPALWRAAHRLAQTTGNWAWGLAGVAVFLTPAVLGAALQFCLGVWSRQWGLHQVGEMLVMAVLSAVLAALAWRLRMRFAKFDPVDFAVWAAVLGMALLLSLVQ